MLGRRNIIAGKSRYVTGLIVLLLISAMCAAFSLTGNDDFAIARREILLRRIGHELLLQSGDSTSRVLPVKKVADDEYQISFDNQLTFIADSLVNTTRRILAKDALAQDYVVTVLDSAKAGVAYGYAISKNKKDDIVACKGREQPRAQYTINIKFKPAIISTVKNKFLLAGLPLLALLGFIFLRTPKQHSEVPEDQNSNVFTLGSMLFDAKNRMLILNDTTTDLTATETRVLSIFASSPNIVIERKRLQKEIWEDEGVIVGRSLDMFISKLRKKMELDPDTNIVVVRGKGYKLESNSR